MRSDFAPARCSFLPARRSALTPLLILVAGAALHLSAPAPGAAATDSAAISTARSADAARGRALFDQQCAICHGTGGRGDGEAAYLLYPKPRDFTRERYHFVSTWEGVPTDDDLFRIITRGIPGSAMPSWGHLSEQARWDLIAYVKNLAEEPWTIDAPTEPEVPGGEGTGVIQVPPEPAFGQQEREAAVRLFAQTCAVCHGPAGRGDGTGSVGLKDDRGYPIRPRDLNAGVLKGGARPADIYYRIVMGIPGTPMPASTLYHGDEAWHLVHYIRSLSSDVMRERAEMKKYRIEARRVDRVPDHPDDGLWSRADPVDLHLMPLWWRYQRPEYLTVRALYDAREIALLLVWADETDDHTAIRPQDFGDAAAVQFSPVPDPPLFAMGTAGAFVNIWMWKAERQANLVVFQDLEAQYPYIGVDSYPNSQRSALEQPLRHALTLESDPLFVTGWGAGNIVSDPTRPYAADDLTAQGFGTLRARPAKDQSVTGNGTYATGSYRVLLRRALRGTGQHAVTFTPGRVVPAAFAIWDGAADDRDGKKSVSIWQDLVLTK